MSYTEYHSGKLVPVVLQEGQTAEQFAETIMRERGETLDEDSLYDTWLKTLSQEGFEEYYVYKEQIFRYVDHKESDTDTGIEVTPLGNGSFLFNGSFYNGGGCLSEHLDGFFETYEPPVENEDPNADWDLVHKALNISQNEGLEIEVFHFAMMSLRDGTSKTIEEALNYGLGEWIK